MFTDAELAESETICAAAEKAMSTPIKPKPRSRKRDQTDLRPGASTMSRVLTFEQAKEKHPNRFTLEHVPEWASEAANAEQTRFFAPQYATDQEWYENTVFPGEQHLPAANCLPESTNQSWPKGKFLVEPQHQPLAISA